MNYLSHSQPKTSLTDINLGSTLKILQLITKSLTGTGGLRVCLSKVCHLMRERSGGPAVSA